MAAARFMATRSTAARTTIAAAVAQGVTAGIVLGAAYRGWMRLISPEPRFSWGGTIAIVVIVTVATLAAALCGAALARVRHRRGRLAVRVVAVALIVLMLGTPPGTVTIPSFLLAGLAWARTDWSVRARRLLGAVAVATTAASLATPAVALGELALWRVTAGVAGYAILIGISAWLVSIPLRPDPPPSTEPARDLGTRSVRRSDMRMLT